MKKICIALLVLALSMPAMAAVTITAAQGPEVNSVIISYASTSGEVRAFALEVTVTDGALVASKTLRQGLTRPAQDDANYYFTPTTSSVGSSTIWPYGLPIVQATGDGCIIEMASLYASNDPCAAHKFAPPSSGVLVKLFVNQALRGADNQITVTVTQANAKRGKVVLANATSVDPDVSGASVTLTFDCMAVGESKGGWTITQTMYNNWVQLGKPPSWCHPGHWKGDANVDCWVNATDIIGLAGSPNFKAAFGAIWPAANYKPSCDTNNDKAINASDIIGDPGLPGSGVKAGFGTQIPNCTPGVLP